jgi:26S proteasome regulatory subunit N10
MPLESCMILLDNSEYMRNGDYIPTRLEAQQDAANLLVGAKTQSHHESTVGVSAGTELLISPTTKVGQILTAMQGLKICSSYSSSTVMDLGAKGKLPAVSNVTSAIQVASLALKHRPNRNGAQRIVLFVGSPLDGIDGRTLAKVGRTLKKNNVAIDVVAMGELEVNEDKLKELVDAANNRTEDGAERTCHLVTIPIGVLPSDVLASSPIIHGGSGGSAFAASAAAAAAMGDFGGGGGDGGASAFAEYGGVDPNMDPELAMALRVSMEEERVRQQRLAAQQAEAASEESKDAEMTDAANAPEGASSAPAAAEVTTPTAMDLGLSEEEALLQQALAMSMNENEPTPTAASSEEEHSKPAASMDTEEDDEAAAMQIALQMSLQQESNTGEESKTQTEQLQLQDPQFVNQLLGSLPGVDPNDPAIQNALSNLKDGEKKGEGKDGSDNKEE